MSAERADEFGANAVSALRTTLSTRTLRTSLAIAVVAGAYFGFAGTSSAIHILVYAMVLVSTLTFVMARLALNARAGDATGSVRSTVGGGHGQAIRAAARFLVLTAPFGLVMALVLYLPSWSVPGSLGVRRAVAFATTVGIAAMVMSPAFLVVAVAAESVGELFDKRRWVALGRARAAEVALAAALPAGVVVLVLAPIVAMASLLFLDEPGTAAVGGVIVEAAFVFAAVASTSLLAQLGGALCRLHVLDYEKVKAAPESKPRTVSVPRRNIVDAESRVAEILAAHPGAPEAALAALEALQRDSTPDPHVAGAIARLHHEHGRLDDASKWARTAIQLFARAGRTEKVVELLRRFEGRLEDLRLQPAELKKLADDVDALAETGLATQLYRSMLAADVTDVRLVRHMIRRAERQLSLGNATCAWETYVSILDIAPDTPVADFVHAEIGRLQRLG